MVPQLVALASAQGGVFTAAQAQSAGYSRREIEQRRKGGRWVALRRGVYAERELVQSVSVDIRARHRLDIGAALLAIRPVQAWASHESAAVLADLEFLTPPKLEVVRLTRPGLAQSRAYRGLRVAPASVPAQHQEMLGGMPATAPARTVVDLSRERPFRDGVVLADSALRREVCKEQLEHVLLDCWNWQGIRDAARVVGFADARAESVAESLARVVFVEQGLPAPEPQVWISDDAGKIGRVDYLMRDQWTIIEVDGKMKYVPSVVDIPGEITPAIQRKLGEIVWREKLREDRLREAGYEVVRVTWADLMSHPHQIRARVLAAFARAQRWGQRHPAS